MLQCDCCDFLKILSHFEEHEFCNKYVCEYSNHVFLDSEFSELSEYPCSSLTVA